VETVTYLVELATGFACVAIGWSIRVRRFPAALLIVAGFAAVAHAVLRLVG
jgi:hypothetical protein